MFSPVPCLLFLLLNTICSSTSSNPDALPADIIARPDFELNSIGLPPESQDEANKMDTDAFEPTYAGRPSEAPPLIIQGNKDQCVSDSNQNSWRKARSKRANFCLPSTDNDHPVVQDSTARKKRRPGTKWQFVPQRTENFPVKAPDVDESRCPGTAPFPVCALSTVATIRPDPSYLDAGSAAGRWILDYCRLPKLEIGCDRTAGEGFWCCQSASEADTEAEYYPLLRITYPDQGRSCIKVYIFPPPPPPPSQP